MPEERFYRYHNYIRNIFGTNVLKIAVDAGFSCPNRSGNRTSGGCIYCNNAAFSPAYCDHTKSISQQITDGIDFFSRKYKAAKYLAYFQSYTNTFGNTEELTALYEEALSMPGISGIVISTRPDCINNSLLNYLQDLSKRKYVMIEYGVESTKDETLSLINRGHNYAASQKAITATAQRGIPVSAHLILGLPGETRQDMLNHASAIATLPITCLKLHQLQIIKGTQLAMQYQLTPNAFHLLSANEYIDLLAEFIRRIPANVAFERFVAQSPPGYLIAPNWGIKNAEFTQMLTRALEMADIHQGEKTKKEP